MRPYISTTHPYPQSLAHRSLIFNGGLTLGAAGILTTAVTTTPARAERQKLAPSDIGYQPRPNGAQRCDHCVNWQAPSACKLVSGTISPSGWCGLFIHKA
jgi:hypothetical protein